MIHRAGKRGFTLIEFLIALGLFLLLISLVIGVTSWTGRAAQGVIDPHADLHAATQKALLTFLKELEESIEFLRPTSGSTLTYFVSRDKTNEIHLAYQELDPAATRHAGRPMYRLYLHRPDPANPGRTTRQLLIDHIERLTFTSRSPGLLQVHLKLHEEGRSYTLLTTVRARSIPSEGYL